MAHRFLTFVLLLCAISPAGMALAGDAYAITGVPIEAYGKNVTAARQKAISTGTVEAAYFLLDRLSLNEDRLALDSPLQISAQMAEALVANIEISAEKRSASHYLARLGVNFDPELVRTFLHTQALPFVETQASPLLVVTRWWTGPEENPVLARAFAAPVFQNQLVPFRLAAVQSGQEAAPGRLEPQALIAMARRTGIADIMVVRGETTGPGSARIRARRVHVGDAGVETVDDMGVFSGQAPDGARPDQVLALRDAALKLSDVLQTRWKQTAMVRSNQLQSVRLSALYDTLAQWQRLRDALGGAAVVEEARLDAFSTDGALLTLTYHGTEQQLARLLAQKGVILANEDIGLTARLR